MEKSSKVTNVAANGTWNGQYGTMYKFEVSFENGDTGEYLSKSQDQNKFVVGNEAAYTITSREHGGRTFYNVKPAMIQQGFQPKAKDPETDKRITRMSVLKVAGDLCIHGEIKLHQITTFAKIFELYVLSGEDTAQALAEDAKHDSIKSKLHGTKTDDLPF
jgi:hypothetical protein